MIATRQRSRSTSRPWCRVLVVDHAEGLWGAQRYLLRLAPLLAERGVDQVLAAPADSAIAAAWSAEGWPHRTLVAPADRSVRTSGGRLDPGRAVREVGRTLTVARRTAVLARACGADVLHANSHWSHLEGAIASRLTGIPCVLHLHEENEPDAVGRLRGRAVTSAEAAIAVSGAVARSLPPRARDNTTVIRNGVDAESLRPLEADPTVRRHLAADPGAPVVLTLSRLDPRKGVDKVIRAVAALPAPLNATQLAIAGAPSLVPEHGERLRALADELLGERARFLGRREDVAELLAASDALVLASSLEGLPLSVLEAQACGVPVVAFPTAGIPEVIDHDENGLLARSGDVADLAAQIARLLGDADLRARLGAAGRASVLEQHTISHQADRQVELLRRVLERRAA